MERLVAMRALLALSALAAVVLISLNARVQGSEGSDDVFASIDVYVRDQMSGSRIPGVAIAVVDHGQIVHARGFGHDGRGNDITARTPFWIGSNTKSFTALATMQLVEAGLVDLDAPVQRYLPEFTTADAEASSRITVRHLLNQTSGFSREDGIAMVAEAKEQTLGEAVAGFRTLELNRPVGDSFEYSNPNFVVLGLLVERVSGGSWQEYVRTNIFDPLAMTNSFATLDEAEAGGLTNTHMYRFGVPRATGVTYLEGLAPTGYLYSSAEDLARYLLMYQQGGMLDGVRVLGEEGIAEMFAPGPTARTFELQGHEFHAHYGAGWFIGPFGAAEDAVWHGGTLPHFIAWMVLLPETDQAVIVLINASHQLPVAGANEVFVRIPLGVVNLLRGATPPAGLSLTRFYIAFDALVLAVVSLQSWSFYRLVWSRPRARAEGVRKAVAFAPLLWEVGVSVAVLALLGLNWAAISTSTPDVAWTLVVVSLLWLATGVARGLHLRQSARRGRSQRPRSEAEA